MVKIKVGVAGAGHLGEHHTRILSRLPELCDFKGIFDINGERAAHIAEKYQVKAFARLEDLLESVDALDIVAPTSAHFSLAQTALKSGRHVFIEKPITENSAQAETLVGLAHAAGLQIQVGHIERFNGAVGFLLSVGVRPRFIEAHRLAHFNPRGTDVSVIHDLMIHDIDLTLMLTDSEVTDIQATAVSVLSRDFDIANARIQFKNGCVANLTSSRMSLKKMRKYRIFQEQKYYSMDLETQIVDCYQLGAAPEGKGTRLEIPGAPADEKITYFKPDLVMEDMLTKELRAFIQALSENKPVPVTGEQGLKALVIAEAIVKKCRHENS